MYNQLLIIILLIIIIYYLENNNKELYTNISQNIDTDTIYQPVAYNNKNKSFKNFGIIGNTPPNPIEENCKLEYNCASFPYNIYSGHNKTQVCTKCKTDTKNYYDLRKPINMSVRTNGQPRLSKHIK